uniref:Uncharacterized protein n=1 Tax=Candidatus Kentrum sp. LPFa TaxID=2126335 RepID=A0A450VS75_9GAMM|nr:MAG: hypothetical protein BECKLPF1236A_GA0070988_1001014 [Candidatus Kentron sp. LPFa]VFK23814.1 MAG: hypothetical protein BECKLPF1236C_GA0070990_100085 [Candidatus Kentron sp. LPFa]
MLALRAKTEKGLVVAHAPIFSGFFRYPNRPGIDSSGTGNPGSTTPTTTPPHTFRVFETNAQGLSFLQIRAIESCNGGSGFMPFHFHETETATLAREYIRNQAYGTDGSEFREQITY